MAALKRTILLTLLFLLLITAGCSIRKNVPKADTPQLQTTRISKNLSYYYGFIDEVPLTTNAKEMLNEFGKPLSFWPAEPQIELFTEIPKVENNAKGIDPITILLPDLDRSKYDGPYFKNDYKTGLEVSVYYRMVADMVTDECIKIYIDAGGNIEYYETVNLGKFDELNLNEDVLTDRMLRFSDAIHNSLSSVTLDFFVRNAIHASSAYALFSNNDGQLVITTTTPLIADCALNKSNILVDLYAVIS